MSDKVKLALGLGVAFLLWMLWKNRSVTTAASESMAAKILATAPTYPGGTVKSSGGATITDLAHGAPSSPWVGKPPMTQTPPTVDPTTQANAAASAASLAGASAWAASQAAAATSRALLDTSRSTSTGARPLLLIRH